MSKFTYFCSLNQKKMNPQLPITIENCLGEKITFKEILHEPDGDRLIVENYVTPGNGPLMHTHFLQEEALTVVEGKIGYQVLGGETAFAGPGETVAFAPGVSHRFWNAGSGALRCTGYIKPANTIIFFLSAIFAAQNKSGSERPEKFDAAYLLMRYSSEYELAGIPVFVRKVVIPITYYTGKLLGKYNHFRNAPEPVKPQSRTSHHPSVLTSTN
jgi:quercetin dioxygenase-like cupin family protein